MKGPASWGRFPRSEQSFLHPSWISSRDLKEWSQGSKILVYGLGRSYGDSCLNSSGQLIETSAFDRILHFNSKTGLLRAQAGLSFDHLIRLFLPRGWFLPVTPGTKYITLGGALANDIHGKNHHRAGCFGNHVKKFELLRSDGSRHICSPEQNHPLFAATIGGLGLTGLVSWIEIQLIPVQSAYFEVETIQFQNLDEFLRLEEESHQSFDYTVSWIDGMAQGARLGRGLYTRGNWAQDGKREPLHGTPLSIPFDFPAQTLNSWTIRGFNWLYFHKQVRKKATGRVHYNPFFYPLDSIGHWNRIYGKQGFLQYQFVIPEEHIHLLERIMETCAKRKLGSFLNVLKRFGQTPGRGLLSFARPGLTYAMDFPNRPETFSLLSELDELVLSNGGALYPAKDARMSPEAFRQSFPRLAEFESSIDPRFESDFWRRVNPSRQQEKKP